MHSSSTHRALRQSSISFQRGLHDSFEDVLMYGDGAQPVHQPLKDSLLLVLIAVVNAGSACMCPEFCGNEEKPQSRNGQCCVLQLAGVS